MKLRLATSCVLFLGLLSGCQSSIALPQPAIGPPTQDPPHGVAETLTVVGDMATDSREVTGSCVTLYLWSQVDGAPEWLPVAVNEILVTAGRRNADGMEVMCTLEGLPGPTATPFP